MGSLFLSAHQPYSLFLTVYSSKVNSVGLEEYDAASMPEPGHHPELCRPQHHPPATRKLLRNRFLELDVLSGHCIFTKELLWATNSQPLRLRGLALRLAVLDLPELNPLATSNLSSKSSCLAPFLPEVDELHQEFRSAASSQEVELTAAALLFFPKANCPAVGASQPVIAQWGSCCRWVESIFKDLFRPPLMLGGITPLAAPVPIPVAASPLLHKTQSSPTLCL